MEKRAELEQPKTVGKVWRSRIAGKDLRSAGAGELEQPKTKVRFAGKRGRRYVDNRNELTRLHEVDLRDWSDNELEALALWLEVEQENRRELASEKEWEERSKTVVSTRYVREGIRCGKENCKCAEEGGELHGPYWYRIDTYGNGRSKRSYHGKKPPPALARQVGFSFSKEKRKESDDAQGTNTTKRDTRARAVRNVAVRRLR